MAKKIVAASMSSEELQERYEFFRDAAKNAKSEDERQENQAIADTAKSVFIDRMRSLSKS